MLIPIVDKQDNIIDHKEKKDITPADIYRISGLALFRPDRTMFIARRSMDKKQDPGKWQPVAVAGTVDKGETYLSNVIKETEEEVGLKIANPTFLFKNRFSANWNFFGSFFAIKMDISTSDLRIDTREFIDSKWIDIEDALTLLKSGDVFTTTAPQILPDIIKHYDDVPLTTL